MKLRAAPAPRSVRPYRTAALSAGILFITATVAQVVGAGLSRSLLDDPAYVTSLSSHATRVAAGAFLEIVAALACAGIAVSLYPVVRRQNAGMALGSVAFRTTEAVMYLAGVACLVSVLALSRRAVGGGVVAERSVGDSLLDLRQQFSLMGVFAFCVGAFLYYVVFYRSELVPRWLSGWGLIGIVLAMVACVLALFTQNEVTSYAVVMLPIGVQEMVLAVWLIAKGFDLPAERSIPETEGRSASAARAGVLASQSRL